MAFNPLLAQCAAHATQDARCAGRWFNTLRLRNGHIPWTQGHAHTIHMSNTSIKHRSKTSTKQTPKQGT
eukprot:5177252-Amphidinium_carterae.1